MSRKNNHWVKQSDNIWIKDYKRVTAIILLDRQAGLYGVMVKNKQGTILSENSELQATLNDAKKFTDEIIREY